MKVLLVLAFLMMGKVFAAHGPEVEIEGGIPRTDQITESAEQKQERLAAEKAQRQAERRAFLAAQRAKSGGKGNVGFKEPAEEQPVSPQAPVVPVVESEEPVAVSVAQEEAIIAAGKPSGFSHSAAGKHPFSTLESVESELSMNKGLQKKITEELGQPGLTPKHEQELVEVLSRLQTQENALENARGFLAFCKASSSPITFTGPELEKIFTVLDLPSLSDASLDGMSVYELGTLKGSTRQTMNNKSGVEDTAKGDLRLALSFIKAIQDDGSVNRKMGEDMGDGESPLKDGYSVYAMGSKRTKFLNKKYFDESFTPEKRDVLVKYLESRLEKVSELLKGKEKVDEDIDPADAYLHENEKLIRVRLEEIEKRTQNILNLLEKNPVDWDDYNLQLEELKKRIKDNSNLYTSKLPVDVQEFYKTLLIKSEQAVKTIEQAAVLPKFENGQLQPNDLKQFVELLKTSRLQPQFIQTLLKQADIFAQLKVQAEQAVNASNIVRMQELQDEMRDFYEDVMRNSWKDENLTKIDTTFLLSMRSSINELLEQFGKKATSFEGVVKNKKSVVAQVKYQFKRLWVRVRQAPRLRYISELPANKESFGLQLVDFKKAADQGYVKSVKSALDSFTKFSKESGEQEKSLRDGNQEKRSQLVTEAKQQVGSAKVIKQQLQALKGIADCNGSLSYKKVEQSLSLGALPSTGKVFLNGLISRGDGESTRFKEVAYLLLEKDGSQDAQTIKETLENKGSLSSGQKEFLSTLYSGWQKGIGVKLQNNPSLSDLRMMTLLQKPPLNDAYLAMVRSPETGQYVLDVYISKKDGLVPSGQAQAIVKQLKSAGQQIDDFITQMGKSIRRWETS